MLPWMTRPLSPAQQKWLSSLWLTLSACNPVKVTVEVYILTEVEHCPAASRTDFYTMDTMQVPQGTGSGFIWDLKGHVVTNFHVIRGASDIKVALIDSSVYPAKVGLPCCNVRVQCNILPRV